MFLGLLFLGAIALVVLFSYISPVQLLSPLQDWVIGLEIFYHEWVTARFGDPTTQGLPIGWLMPLAFLGGLIASLSPCILAMLPVNLSYIGTREIKSKQEALLKALAFVVGVVTVLSILGLFSAIANVILIRFQGYIYVAVGLLILLMGLALLGLIKLNIPQTHLQLPFSGSFGFGLTFALVTSPCNSPFLFTILAAAASTESKIQSVLTMVSYALGYTAVIFLASLFTGLARQTRAWLRYTNQLLTAGGAVLLITGLYYVSRGVHWIIQIAIA